MIRVIYQKKDDRISYIRVRGHAESAEYGKDLICASVSSIMFGLMNALDELDEDIEIRQLTNDIEIRNHSTSEVAENYFRLVLVQLRTIEEAYGDFIKVERK